MRLTTYVSTTKTANTFPRHARCVALHALTTMIFMISAVAQAQVIPSTAGINTQTIKLSPQVSIGQLRSQPTAKVQLSSGRIVSARSVIAVTDALKDMQAKRGKLQNVDLKFSRPTGQAQVTLNPSNLAVVRTMAPTTVLALPNGLKMTAAELKKIDAFEARLSPKVKQLLGGSLTAGNSTANRYAGKPVIDIRTEADVAKLKNLPDSTVIRAANGSMSTLGDLKAELIKKYGPTTK
jgi:hypothetical protein